MDSIDDILISRIFSPVAGWIQHHRGVDQWRLSIECLNGNIAFYLAGVALTIAGKGLEDGIFATMLGSLLWLFAMEFVRRRALMQAGSSMGVQTARLGEWIFRILLIAVLPISLWHAREWDNLCYSISLAMLAAHLYFKACDAPPPEVRRGLAWQGS